MLSENCLAFIEQHENDLLQLIETLCGICAPSNQEHQRTVFVEQWLKKQGCEHVKAAPPTATSHFQWAYLPSALALIWVTAPTPVRKRLKSTR